ncbi:serine protease inhibitor [Arthrobacter sp. AB6]|uniref:serine protease inhibitor n=1 Tax=Arthrobacter sp. AB6 TaxID=2962570 RepID=UPI00288291C1|nr:serine protease inhibitor [Arthrobacter sp. AB6]MDT0195277.1 serine protease inhibitor [Arthrobacter sp. AB6]
MIDLTVRLREDPAAVEQVFRLIADDGRAQPGSTLPDPEAALAAVEKFGEDIFFPKPGPPRLCTQQYGGPQMAVVTGVFHGRPVDSTFARTDGCEIARWKAMAPLLGSAGGAWGST